MASSSSNHPPCAACKFLRRKCQPECVFAPYFSPDHPQKFINVHRIFGASNVSKLLNELHPHQREDAVNSLAYEAEMRLRDPVNGCVGIISLLHQQLHQLQMDLQKAKFELLNIQNFGMMAPTIRYDHIDRMITTTTINSHHSMNGGDNQHYHQFVRNFDEGNVLATNIGQLSQLQQPSGGVAVSRDDPNNRVHTS